MPGTSTDPKPSLIVAAAQEAELELIAAEQKAVRKLADALKKLEKEQRNLQKAQQKVDERQAEVDKAQHALALARDRRLAGSAVPEEFQALIRYDRNDPPVRD